VVPTQSNQAEHDGGGTSPLRKVQLQSASDVVLEQLQQLILEGRLRPGERLPAEQELSEALGVGRSTVREAKKTLTDRGLIESRGRLGTFVVGPPTDITRHPALRHLLADPTLPDLYEGRLVVEVAAIRLATQRASDRDISELYDYLRQVERDIVRNDADVWPRLVTFHRSLVRMAHNNVLLSIFDLLAHLLMAHQVPFYPSVAELQREVVSHRELVDCIAGRDPEAATELMRDHLDESEQLRTDALKRGEDR
jgi:GntR family transcriptional regulator, transcriptional repressor for pyruvate dehydrogenase complex